MTSTGPPSDRAEAVDGWLNGVLAVPEPAQVTA